MLSTRHIEGQIFIPQLNELSFLIEDIEFFNYIIKSCGVSIDDRKVYSINE